VALDWSGQPAETVRAGEWSQFRIIGNVREPCSLTNRRFNWRKVRFSAGRWRRRSCRRRVMFVQQRLQIRGRFTNMTGPPGQMSAGGISHADGTMRLGTLLTSAGHWPEDCGPWAPDLYRFNLGGWDLILSDRWGGARRHGGAAHLIDHRIWGARGFNLRSASKRRRRMGAPWPTPPTVDAGVEHAWQRPVVLFRQGRWSCI